MQKLTSIFLSIVLFFFDLFTPSVPQQKTTEQLNEIPEIFQKFDIGDKLYVINSGVLNSIDKMHMAICLQGIVAKTNPCIYIKTNSIDNYYIGEIQKSGVEILYDDQDGNAWTLKTLLDKFKSYVNDSGYVLYRESASAEGLNMATNLATINRWLAVPESLEDLAIDAGLIMKENFADDSYNTFFQWKFFEKYKKFFNYTAVVHERYEMKALRDFAIQQGFFTFYVDDDEDGVLLRKRILDYASHNTFVLGWAKYEKKYVNNASNSGDLVVPSDHCYNNSILTSFEYEFAEQKRTDANDYTDPTKHYCALLFSDGDNVQWIQNGFSEFYKRQNLGTDFPMTWTFPPLMQEMSPLTYKKIYDDSTADDYFIAGVSGAGYIHSSQYPYKALSGFTDITASMMMKSDLEYVTFLDTAPSNAIEEARLTKSFEYYARYDNIKGGVVYLDPGRYAGGDGKVYFVNDKPFVCARFSLWHPSNEMSGVTKEWIDEQADIVNNYDADIHSINGYSIVNIHPWSISIDNLEYFVNQLDEDVVLVTVDELLQMIEKNIPHVTTEVN